MVEPQSLGDCVAHEDGPSPVEERTFIQDNAPEKTGRRLPGRTPSMPKRTIWKDKGGQARYVRGEEPKPLEVTIKPLGLGAAAKEALTDAVLTGGAAGLAIVDAVQTTRRRFERTISERRLKTVTTEDEEEVEEQDGDLPFARTSEPAISCFVPATRGLLRRAKSLSSVYGGGGIPRMPQRSESPETQRPNGVATTAA